MSAVVNAVSALQMRAGLGRGQLTNAGELLYNE